MPSTWVDLRYNFFHSDGNIIAVEVYVKNGDYFIVRLRPTTHSYQDSGVNLVILEFEPVQNVTRTR